MVDTKNQYLAIKEEVDLAIQNVLDTAAYINGKAVQDFSKNLGEYLGIEYVVPCANGTDALQIAMMVLDLQPGDEVITPSFTYIATTEVVALLGLTPVFVDVDPVTYCMDIASLKKAIIEKFIQNNPKIIPLSKDKNIVVTIEETKPDSTLMTETLAKVYLEQKKYENAIQAYRILSLKYPEKSGFFADQIKRVQILQKNKQWQQKEFDSLQVRQ